MKIHDKILAFINPDLAKEWHPTKNGKLTPFDITYGSGKKIWWKCKNGHEWTDMPCRRTPFPNIARECPYCSGYKASKGNCLSLLNESLAKEWHPTKNKSLSPDNVTCKCHKKVYWKCSKGHEWKSTVANRTKGSGCPYCSNKKVYTDNCLATKNPELSKEWHPTKNKSLTPFSVTARSDRVVWWKCKNNHEWSGKIVDRTTLTNNKRSCPYCCGQKGLYG